MKPRAKDIEVNIYRKFQTGRDQIENVRPSEAPCCRSPPDKCACPPREDPEATLQELTQSIQLMQNRLKYIESAKQRHERQMETTLKRTNSFITARIMADELHRKVVEVKAREESQKTNLRTKAAEIQSQHKRMLLEKTIQIKNEKTRLSDLVKQERLELERKTRQMQEEDMMAKKSKVLKVKEEKQQGRQGGSVVGEGEKLVRRGSMFNLDIQFHKTEGGGRRRVNHSQNDKGSGAFGLARSKSKNVIQ